MSFADDLEYVLAHGSGHTRFRDLTDPQHPDYDPRYIPIVETEACRLRGGPSLPEKAATFVRAVVRHVKDGMRRVPEHERLARLAVCLRCPANAYRAEDRKCILCDCYLPEKAAWNSERCPRSYWPGESEAKASPSGGCGCGR